MIIFLFVYLFGDLHRLSYVDTFIFIKIIATIEKSLILKKLEQFFNLIIAQNSNEYDILKRCFLFKNQSFVFDVLLC